MQEVLGSRLIDSLDSGRVSSSCFSLIAASNRSIKLLQSGLELALSIWLFSAFTELTLTRFFADLILGILKTPPSFSIQQ